MMELSQVIENFISGDWGTEETTDANTILVSCVRGADIVPISNGQFDNIPQRYISEKSLQKRLLSEGDLIIEKSGGSPVQSTGRIVYVSKELIDAKVYVVCSNFCTAIRVKKVWNPLYIYYYWQQVYNSGVFFNFEGKTSGIKNLQLDNALSAIKIDDVSMRWQNSIVKVLYSLEQKLWLNRSINANLEAMAKQLYDYWFVQFDFPDSNGRPYKSSGGRMLYNPKLKREIPIDWHCGSLLDIAEYTNGLACQRYRPREGEGKLPVIKIREMHEGISSDTEFVKEDIPECLKVYDGDVLFSWSASLEVMLWAYGRGGLNQHIFKVTSKNNFPRSFFFYQLSDYVVHFKKIAEARKTTMGHITQDHLRLSTIAIPDDTAVADKLEQILHPIFDRIIANYKEIRDLTALRDSLLPMLMNGQVTVR